MRAVIQKVTRAQVDVLDSESRETCGKIGAGLMVLLGVGHDDGAQDARYIADKIAYLRIFEDENGRLNRSVQDIGGMCCWCLSSPCTPMRATDGGLLFLPLPRRRRPMRGMKKWPLYCAGMV